MLVFTERWFVRLAVFFEFWSFSLCAVLLIPSSVMSDSKQKNRQCSSEYLTFGFICCPNNRSLPMCVLCERVLSNGAMKVEQVEGTPD
uniref:Secreted protein n=1 Tax=Trichuris muris TaxID=70415 RepID=A0A5S6QEH6_TRIMR